MAMRDFPDMYAQSLRPEGIHIRDLPDMYAQSPRALGRALRIHIRDLPDMYAQSPRAEGIHIRQIPHGHVTTIIYHFVPIVTTPAL